MVEKWNTKIFKENDILTIMTHFIAHRNYAIEIVRTTLYIISGLAGILALILLWGN